MNIRDFLKNAAALAVCIAEIFCIFGFFIMAFVGAALIQDGREGMALSILGVLFLASIVLTTVRLKILSPKKPKTLCFSKSNSISEN